MLFARWRPIPLVLVALFTSLAFRQFVNARDRDRQFQAWLVEEPAAVVVDPRVAGSTAFSLHISCTCAHGYPVMARGHDTTTSLLDVATAVGAWKARLVDPRTDGAPDVERSLSPCNAVEGSAYGGVCLAYLRSPESGRLELIVDEPAPSAAPERIEIYVRNHLCGLEGLPAVIARSLGFGAAFVALVAVPFVPMPPRIGRSVAAPTARESPS